VVIVLCVSISVAWMLEGRINSDMGAWRFGDVVADPGWGFRLLTIITLTTGTALLMWLGEQATERGIGNGISIIIFASIVSGIPGAVTTYWAGTGGEVQPLTISLLLAVLVVSIAT